MKKCKHRIYLFFVLICLFSSYLTDVFHVSGKVFAEFERIPEGLIVGKMYRSQQDAIFAYGGLAGVNIDSTYTFMENYSRQHDDYLTQAPLAPHYYAYKSQSGGQGIVYSFIQQLIPFDNSVKLQIIKAINALLSAFCFMLIIGWIGRNISFLSSLCCFVLLLLSPWVNNFSHNLWWSFWNFYLPFLCMLLALECRQKYPDRMSYRKLFLLLAFAVFLKCFFTGFEYITACLLSIYCPLLFYAVLNRDSFRKFIKDAFIYGLSALCGLIAGIFLLLVQIRAAEGTFRAGVEHIIFSYEKRATFDITPEVQKTLYQILVEYVGDNAFKLGFLPEGFVVPFWGVIGIVILASLFLYRYSLNSRNLSSSINRALSLATIFSIICPLSWIIIFKQHAVEHPHLDYIVWYMPFLLFGFASIGQCIFTVLRKKSECDLKV